MVGVKKLACFLLLPGHFMPIGLHSIPQLHPQLGLILRRHLLPPLLDVGEGGIGNGVFMSALLTRLIHAYRPRPQTLDGRWTSRNCATLDRCSLAQHHRGA